MNKAQGWGAVEAILRSLGPNVRGFPHIVSTNKAFAAADQTLDVNWKFAAAASWFIWTHALYASSDAAVTACTDTVFGGAICTMSSVGNYGPIDNGEAFPITALFGRDGVGGGAKALPTPVLMKGSTELKMSTTNKVAGVHTLYLSLIGVRVI